MTEKTKEFLIEDLFNKWAGDLRTEFSDIRYLHKERPDLLENLFGLFKSSKISYEDAKDYKNRAVIELTTEEGRKGVGRHRGWKKASEKDYDVILASFYVDVEVEEDLKIPASKKEKPEQTFNLQDYYTDNNFITAWARNRWKESWTPALNKECHLIGSSLNIVFQQEMFESDIFNDNNSLPEWFEIACN